MFFVLLSKTLVFAVFCEVWVFTAFSVAPAKDIKTQKCCNLQHFVNFEKLKIVRKMCQNGIFSDFRYPRNGGDYALGDAYERPGFRGAGGAEFNSNSLENLEVSYTL